MPVNTKRVNLIISDAITHARSDSDTCCGRVRQAWRNLKAWRDQPPAPGERANSLDLDVAAAENYMFARAMVCEGFVSELQMNSIALIYYATKLAGVNLATSDNPQSESSYAVAGWGGKGSQEGANDRRRCNPSVSPPLWRPVNEIMNLGNGYLGGIGSAGTRYAPPAPSP